MNKFLLFVFIGTLASAISASGQDQTVMPPSPEASALAKSINFPVAYNTGVPDISVPLYEIKTSGGVSLPVSMSYHAGGFRINEKPTSIGMGWSLSTSLQVSRSVNGMDDLQTSNGYYYRGFLDWQNPPSHSVADYFHLLRGELDEQPDAFNYRLLNKSGTFYFYKSQSNPTVAVTVPYTGIKIELIGNTNISGSNLHCFKITDTDGTVYWFGRNADNPYSDIAVESTSSAPFGSNNFTSQISAWKCINIISPNKADIIQFEYADKGTQFINTFSDRIELHEATQCWGSSGGYCPPVGGLPFNDGAGTYLYGPYTPLCASTGIYYPQGGGTSNWDNQYSPYPLLTDSVSLFRMTTPRYFNYSSGPDVGLYVPWFKPDGLGNYSQEHTKYEINEGGSNSGNGIVEDNVTAQDLQLSRITFPGGKLEFNLVGGTVVSGYQQSISRLSSIDIYNNSDTLIKTISFFQSEAANCSDATPYSQKKVSPTRYLDSVKVTRDNVSERYAFEYRDKYCFTNLKGSDSWGGVNASTTARDQYSSVPATVKQSTHYPDNLCENQTSIEYTIGDGDKQVDTGLVKSGIIRKITYPGGGSTVFEFGSNQYKDQYNVTHLAGGLRVEKIRYYDGINSQPAFEKIYKYGAGEDNIGIVFSVPSMETINYGGYKYSQNMQYGWYNGSSPTYSWNWITTETKTTYTTDSFLDLFYASGAPIHYLEIAEYQTDIGSVTGKTIYNYDPGFYNSYDASYVVTGTNLVGKPATWHMGKLASETNLKYNGSSYDTLRKKKYTYYRLEKEKVYAGQVFQNNLYRGVYHSGAGHPMTAQYTEVPDLVYQVSDFTDHPYQITSGTMQLEKEEETWREGGNVLTKTTDYTYGDELQLKQARESQSDGRTLVTKITYPKDYASGTTFIDDLVSNYMVSSPIEKTTAMDDGSTQKVVSGQIITYLADDTGLPDKTYRLETDAPLTSFQVSTTSGFNPDSHYQENMTYSYDGAKKLSAVSPANNLATVYLWGYGGQYPIAEIRNADYATVVSTLGGSTAVSSFRDDPDPTDNEVNTFLSSLRSSLPTALVTTYTYKPLVGVTSQTDAKGMTTYYEYDTFQRLKQVKDHYGRIVKSYDYHYKQ